MIKHKRLSDFCVPLTERPAQIRFCFVKSKKLNAVYPINKVLPKRAKKKKNRPFN